MTMWEAKFIHRQVLNQAYCAKHFTDYQRVEITEVRSFGNCMKIIEQLDFNWMPTDEAVIDCLAGTPRYVITITFSKYRKILESSH